MTTYLRVGAKVVEFVGLGVSDEVEVGAWEPLFEEIESPNLSDRLESHASTFPDSTGSPSNQRTFCTCIALETRFPASSRVVSMQYFIWSMSLYRSSSFLGVSGWFWRDCCSVPDIVFFSWRGCWSREGLGLGEECLRLKVESIFDREAYGF